VHYPNDDTGKKVSTKGQATKPKPGNPISSPMSVSLPSTQVTASMKTSHTGSDFEGDVGKNALDVDGDEFCDGKSCEFVIGSGRSEIQSPIRQLNLFADNAIASVLSPFAKVFTPRVDLANGTGFNKKQNH